MSLTPAKSKRQHLCFGAFFTSVFAETGGKIMRRWSKGLALLAVIVATAFIMSCAEERDPINRVQPNVIKKAMLDGEWY